MEREWELRSCENSDPVSGLESLADLSVDVVITDPPYSAHVHELSRGMRRAGRGRPGETEVAARDLGFDSLSGDERWRISRECARLARRWVLVFCDHEGSDGWRNDLQAAGLEYVRTCVWIKVCCTPQLSGDRPAAGHECVVVAHQTRKGKPVRKRWNGGGKRGVYVHPVVPSREGRVHTTQKPLALMRELVEDFTDPGELVLDPYAGSGTTGVACRMLGRRFLGYERDQAMAEIARRRIAGERAVPSDGQMEMFE